MTLHLLQSQRLSRRQVLSVCFSGIYAFGTDDDDDDDDDDEDCLVIYHLDNVFECPIGFLECVVCNIMVVRKK